MVNTMNRSRVPWISDTVRWSPPSCALSAIISLRPPGVAEKKVVTRSKRENRQRYSQITAPTTTT